MSAQEVGSYLIGIQVVVAVVTEIVMRVWKGRGVFDPDGFTDIRAWYVHGIIQLPALLALPYFGLQQAQSSTPYLAVAAAYLLLFVMNALCFVAIPAIITDVLLLILLEKFFRSGPSDDNDPPDPGPKKPSSGSYLTPQQRRELYKKLGPGLTPADLSPAH